MILSLKANGTTAAEISTIKDDGAGNISYGTVSGNRHEFTFTAATAVRTITFPNESGTVAFQKIKASWDADAISQDGTFCTDPTGGVINSGPRTRWFTCADNNSSIFEGKLIHLPYAITTAEFTLKLNHAHYRINYLRGGFLGAMPRVGNDSQQYMGHGGCR